MSLSALSTASYGTEHKCPLRCVICAAPQYRHRGKEPGAALHFDLSHWPSNFDDFDLLSFIDSDFRTLEIGPYGYINLVKGCCTRM